MINKRILVLVSLLLVSFLLVGCDWFTVPVIENKAPVITSTPVTTATVGVKYTYEVKATDPNGDALTYSLVVKPTYMTIDTATGVIKWIPRSTELEYNSVTVEVTDGVLNATQPFTIFVTARKPMTITANLPTFKVGEPYWFTVNMIANDDSGKEVIASFKMPTSKDGVEITGTLETDVGSDLTFELVDNVFQSEFTMEDATVNFRGTFDEAGTYSTTIEVKTTDGTLLCSKDIDIVVESVPVPPVIDGILSLGEWDDATEISVTGEMSTVWALATTDALYLAFDVSDKTDNRVTGTGLDVLDWNVGLVGDEVKLPWRYVLVTKVSPDGSWGDSWDAIDGYHGSWADTWDDPPYYHHIPVGLEMVTSFATGNRVTEFKVPMSLMFDGDHGWDGPNAGDVLLLGGDFTREDADGQNHEQVWWPDDWDSGDASTYEDITVQ